MCNDNHIIIHCRCIIRLKRRKQFININIFKKKRIITNVKYVICVL